MERDFAIDVGYRDAAIGGAAQAARRIDGRNGWHLLGSDDDWDQQVVRADKVELLDNVAATAGLREPDLKVRDRPVARGREVRECLRRAPQRKGQRRSQATACAAALTCSL